jgi:hypothetical protein
MTASMPDFLSPLSKFLDRVSKEDLQKMTAIIEAAEGGPEPDNSGISTEEFLAAAKTVADRYART